jgi:7-cyano-7-deazaguanine tRNA-ribosyltransferase
LTFEVSYSDLAARIGKLETPHGILETPAFVPVVHPVRQSISPDFIKSIGFGAVITNAYITLRYFGDQARKSGIHRIINYDGVIMTDSGGYQVLEYGSIKAEAAVIAQFEKDIRSDICVPLDKPTGYGLEYEKANSYVKQTLMNAKETLMMVTDENDESDKHSNNKKDNHFNESIWAGPIQGAEHLDLVRYSAEELDKMGFKLMALGSPVEILEAYEFSVLGQMIAAAKRAVPTKPIHLFGAGHPLTIPLVVALGCDMFDSASYMLYAKDNRYMHANGTVRLEDLRYLPCHCPVCTSHTVKELLSQDKNKRTIEIAKHNLYILKAEICLVKQAIMDGRLWEYAIQKARSHPKLMESIELFKNFELLEEGTPIFKQKAIFLYDPLDQYRPEARQFRKMVSKFRSSKTCGADGGRKLILYPEPNIHPFYTTQDFKKIAKKFPDAQVCTYNRFLGIIPVEISDIFPAAHNFTPKELTTYQANDYPSFIDSLKEFLAENNFDEIIIVADIFIRNVIDNNGILLKKFKTKIFDYEQGVISRL